MRRQSLKLSMVVAWLALSSLSWAQAPDWSNLRSDHPRLYFNADTWPAVRARAEGICRNHLTAVRKTAENLTPPREWSDIERPPRRPGSEVDTFDWGERLMAAALVQRLEPTPQRLERIRQMMWASLDYYHACFAQGKAVSWYGFSRLHWLCALDWLWDELPEGERLEMARSFLTHLDEALHGPAKQRQNRGAYQGGYYGVDNVALFAGLALLGTGADESLARRCLDEGYGHYQQVIAHRRHMAGDEGGAASPTLGYSMGEYPLAEWNYLHCMESALGEDRRAELSYVAGFSHYIMWNVLPGLLEYGYGDTPHTTNQLVRWPMYNHLSQLMHFYGRQRPGDAAMAAYLREQFPVYFNAGQFCIYPFVLTELEQAPAPLEAGKLPAARFFPLMGQVFMRSGDGPTDTYCMIAGDGPTAQHRHYDAGHFTIFKQGFLALDTGTRQGNTDNLQNYFAQTIAHNCLLIKMPGEKPSPYWNGEVFAQAGGQNRQVGSRVIAFETGPLYTYVAIDLTPVYHEAKCTQAVRQFLFIMPDHFVVFDRVVSPVADYGKTWLLHFANEPELTGAIARADQAQGRIFCHTLLPADASLTKVGGPGKEFLVEGVNYDLNAGPSQSIIDREYTGITALQYEEVPELMGRWRLEVKPRAPRQADVFLHLLQVGDQSLTAMDPAQVHWQLTPPAPPVGQLIEEEQAVMTFTAHGAAVVLRLPVTGPIGGHLTITKDGHQTSAALAQTIQPYLHP